MTDQTTYLDQIKSLVLTFCELRGWRVRAEPKDVAISISLESAELLEHFQWRNDLSAESLKNSPIDQNHIAHELADILIYAILFADRLNIDLTTAIQNKLQLNEKKYPLKLFKSKKMDLKKYKKIKQQFRKG
jgi:dCTP diphosphatase